MSPTPALTEKARPSSLIPGLELVRGLASLQVFGCHLFLIFLFHGMSISARPFWVETFFNFSGEAVLTFFVLSGLVIAISQENQSRDWVHFLRARLRRLGPLYLFAILLAIIADRILLHHFDPFPLWGHLLFLQGNISPLAPCFYSNRPLWSLSYESYFYLFFAASIGRRTPWIHTLLWIAAFLLMGLTWWGYQPAGLSGHLAMILAFMPVWLLGTTLIHKPIYFRPTLGQNLVLFSIMFLLARCFLDIPFLSPAYRLLEALFIAPFLYSLANPGRAAATRPGWISWLIIGAIYLIAAVMMQLHFLHDASYPYRSTNNFLMFVPPLAFLAVILGPGLGWQRITAKLRWQPFALFLGRISYAVYVVHWPICAVVLQKVHGSSLVRFILDLVLVFGLSWWLEYHFHPWLCRKFDWGWPNTHVRKPALAPVQPLLQNEPG